MRALRPLWLEGRLALPRSAWGLLAGVAWLRWLNWPRWLIEVPPSPWGLRYWSWLQGMQLAFSLIALLLHAALWGREVQGGTLETLCTAPRPATAVWARREAWLLSFLVLTSALLTAGDPLLASLILGPALLAGSTTILLTTAVHHSVGLGVGLGWWSWSTWLHLGAGAGLPELLRGLSLWLPSSESVSLTLQAGQLPASVTGQLFLASILFALTGGTIAWQQGSVFDGMRRRRRR